MKSPDFTANEILPAEEFGGSMTMNGDDNQMGLDISSLFDKGVDALYEAQKELLSTQQKKLEAQAVKTTGEFVSKTASDILAQPEVKKLAAEEAKEAAVQKVATSINTAISAIQTSPGKYFIYIAIGALGLAGILKLMRKK